MGDCTNISIRQCIGAVTKDCGKELLALWQRYVLFASSTKNYLFKSAQRKAAQLLGILVENVTRLRAPLSLCSLVPDFTFVLGVNFPEDVDLIISFKAREDYGTNTSVKLSLMVTELLGQIIRMRTAQSSSTFVVTGL